MTDKPPNTPKPPTTPKPALPREGWSDGEARDAEARRLAVDVDASPPRALYGGPPPELMRPSFHEREPAPVYGGPPPRDGEETMPVDFGSTAMRRSATPWTLIVLVGGAFALLALAAWYFL